jgi:hypothetical protein
MVTALIETPIRTEAAPLKYGAASVLRSYQRAGFLMGFLRLFSGEVYSVWGRCARFCRQGRATPTKTPLGIDRYVLPIDKDRIT